MQFEPILNFVARFMEEAGDFTWDNERLLSNLRNISRIFQTVREHVSINTLFKETMESVCEIVLFSGYIPIKCCTTALSKLHREMQAIETTQLPERFQPEVQEIKSYLESLIEKNRTIDSTINEANSKVGSL